MTEDRLAEIEAMFTVYEEHCEGPAPDMVTYENFKWLITELKEESFRSKAIAQELRAARVEIERMQGQWQVHIDNFHSPIEEHIHYD